MFEDQAVEMLPARTTMGCAPSPCGGSKRGKSGGTTFNYQSGNDYSAHANQIGLVNVNGNALNNFTLL